MLIAGQCTLLRPGRPPGEAAFAASATFSILINEHTKPKPQRCVQLSVGNPCKVNMAAIAAAVAALRCWLGVYYVYPVKNRKNSNDIKCSTAQFNTCHSPEANIIQLLASHTGAGTSKKPSSYLLWHRIDFLPHLPRALRVMRRLLSMD